MWEMWQAELSSAMLAFWLMTTPPLAALAFWLVRCNGSYDKVVDKVSSGNGMARNTVKFNILNFFFNFHI